MSDCKCEIPPDAIICSTLEVVEYMDADGQLFKIDFSRDGAGEELPLEKILELCEWAKMINLSPILASMVRDMLFGDDEEENAS